MTKGLPPENLLATACEELRTQLAPSVQGRQRYQALMAANAVAIANRQLQAGPGSENEYRRRLEALLGSEKPSASNLEALEARLTAAIRRGDFVEEPQRSKLLAALWRYAAAQARVWVPRALTDRDEELLASLPDSAGRGCEG